MFLSHKDLPYSTNKGMKSEIQKINFMSVIWGDELLIKI